MTIKIQGKDCAFCLLFVAEDGDDHDYECLLHASDRAKDGPGDSCPGPGEYDLVPVGGVKDLKGYAETQLTPLGVKAMQESLGRERIENSGLRERLFNAVRILRFFPDGCSYTPDNHPCPMCMARELLASEDNRDEVRRPASGRKADRPNGVLGEDHGWQGCYG